MIPVLVQVLLDPDDIRARWRRDVREMWLRDVRAFAILLTMAFCLLAIAIVIYIVARILEKKNDFGDEDEMKMRKSIHADASTINARMYVDIASGSTNCMKNFHCNEVGKRKL